MRRRFLIRVSIPVEFLALILSIASLMVSTLAAFYAYSQQEKQAKQSSIASVRAQYPRISELLTGRPKGIEGLELDAQIGIAAATLAELEYKVPSPDMLFVGDAHRRNAHPELALPLYDRAIEMAEIPFDRIVALRARGYTQSLLGSHEEANASLQRALDVNELAGFTEQVRLNNDANTERVWVDVAWEFNDCTEIRAHGSRYLSLIGRIEKFSLNEDDEDRVRQRMRECGD